MTKKQEKSSHNQEKIPCDYCGKPSVVWWEYETLCENCWKGAKIAYEDKKKWQKN